MITHEECLGNIANIQIGYQSRGRIEEDLRGGFILIRPQDIEDTGIILQGTGLRFSPTINPDNCVITPGDILIQARGQRHSAFLTQDIPSRAVASNSFYIVCIQDHNTIVPGYLVWWLNLPNVQAYFEQMRGVSTIPFISKSVLEKTKVRIPPLDIQNDINSLMELWQREQKLTHQLLAKKESLIQEICIRAISP